MQAPKVTVQIITYWSAEIEKDLEDLRQEFEQVDYPRDRWRIVIIDNPSPKGRAVDYLKRTWFPLVGATLPEIDLIVNEVNNGFAGGHMTGWTASKAWDADYVYLLNQDASVDPTFLSTVMAQAESEPDAAIWQSRIMLKQEPTLLNTRGNALHFLGFGYSLGYRQTPEEAAKETLPVFYASGAAVLLRASVIHKIGLFDPSYFMYHDDVDLSWRARLAGYGVNYAQASVVFHRYEFSRSIKKFYWMERNRHLTNLANYKLATLLLIAPAMLVMEIGTCVFAIKGGWGKEKVRSWLHFFKPSTWIAVLRARYAIRGIRRVSDREVLSHMVGVIVHQETHNPIVIYLVNPILSLYLVLLRALVRW